MSLLGIDIGSGSCKAVAFDYSGKIIALASQSYSTCSPVPGMAELDAEIFWNAVQKVTRQVASEAADPIEALSISSHGETIIPIDNFGNAIAPAIMNSDNRAVEQAAWWEKTLGREKIYEITGLPIHAMFALNKIMWVKEHQPEVFSRVDKFVSVEDYIIIKMGLPAYTDYSLASRTMAFDIKKKKWSNEILECAGIHENKLSIPIQSGTIAGRLTSSTAATLGLREGTIVAMGGHDQPCGAFGSGVIDKGEVADSAGTYECLTAVTETPGNTGKALQYSLNSYCHVIPNRYVTLAFFPAGLVTRWFLEQFCFEDKMQVKLLNKTLFDILDENTAKITQGPTGLCITPHFVGSCNPNWDVRATGAMVGLTPQITRYHMYKALYEGIACELAINVKALEEITGNFECIRISGGNTGSAFTVQLRSDLTGKRMQLLHTSEAACQGAAMLAGLAAGIYKDAGDAVRTVVRIGKTYTPDIESRELYLPQLKRYMQLYPSLASIRSCS